MDAVYTDVRQLYQQTSFTPNALKPVDKSQPPVLLDPNSYSTKKTVMTVLCLIIIIMANSVQLKFVIKHKDTLFMDFYNTQVGLGATSVILTAITGFILMYAARINFSEEFKQRKIDYLNNISMLLLFILTIVNIFIVAMN